MVFSNDVCNIRSKAFVLNWVDINKNLYIFVHFFNLTSKCNFMCLFRWVKIETHFPMKSPFLILSNRHKVI